MKHILPLIALGVFTLLGACGDFYTFEEIAPSAQVTMRVERDTAYVLVGDSMPLRATFSPDSTGDHAVFWTAPSYDSAAVARVVNDTAVALREGEIDMVAIGTAGAQRDTCHVIVLPPWQSDSRSAWQDMIIYARVTMNGREFDPACMTVAAFNGDLVAGVGELKTWKGMAYVQLRLFLDTETIGDYARIPIIIKGYDRSTYSLYRYHGVLYFDGATHGTLSNLFQLDLY